MDQVLELSYALDTFYFLIMGAFVMWMAAGFAMLEAGLVRSKNTTEILLKNVALFAVACTMYLIVGYYLMYGGGLFLAGIDGGETLVEDALAASNRADRRIEVEVRPGGPAALVTRKGLTRAVTEGPDSTSLLPAARASLIRRHRPTASRRSFGRGSRSLP